MNFSLVFIPLLALPGGPELFIIFIVILLFFDGKKIPELLGGIGRGVRELKNEKEQIDKKVNRK
ncbi:MAG: Sec-independent protein translocase subunit TatA/TatB [Ginsengibacter sp.]